MNVELVNVIGGNDLGKSLDLHTLSFSLNRYSPNYEPEVAPGLYFELPDIGVTVMVFGSGKYHLTGGESIKQIYEADADFVRIIEHDMDIEVKRSKPEIRNLVYRGEFEREFDLAELAVDLPNSEYAAEEQPGIKYRSDTFPGLMTIFRTGTFTITGSNQERDAKGLVEEFQAQFPN